MKKLNKTAVVVLIALMAIACKKSGIVQKPISNSNNAEKQLFSVGCSPFQWAIKFDLDDQSKALVRVDKKNGYKYVAITHPDTLPNRYTFNTTIKKYDSNNNLVWSHSLGNCTARKLALDNNNNLYFMGDGAIGLTVPGTNIFKFNLSGDIVWQEQIARSVKDLYFQVSQMDVDGNGNVYYEGGCSKDFDLDPGPGTFYTTNTTLNSRYFVKLDANGKFVIAQQISIQYVFKILPQADGSVIFVGYGGDTTPKIGIQKYSSSGVLVYNTLVDYDLSGNANQFEYSVLAANDPAGNTYVYYVHNIYKFDATGHFLLKAPTPFDLANEIYRNAMTVDNDGSIYFTGKFKGNPDFDAGPENYHVVPYNGQVIFVDKYSTECKFIGAISFRNNGNGLNEGTFIQVVGSDVYVAGDFTNTVDFNPTQGVYELTPSITTAAFYVKLSQCK